MKPDLKKLILPSWLPNSKGARVSRVDTGSTHASGQMWQENIEAIERSDFLRYSADLLANIEKLENEAIPVYGQVNRGELMTYSEQPSKGDTYRQWYFPSLTEEIDRPVTKADIVKELRRWGLSNDFLNGLADRVEATKGGIE